MIILLPGLERELVMSAVITLRDILKELLIKSKVLVKKVGSGI